MNNVSVGVERVLLSSGWDCVINDRELFGTWRAQRCRRLVENLCRSRIDRITGGALFFLNASVFSFGDSDFF